MELNDLKLNFFKNKIQVVIFDQNERLIDSCDSLVKFERDTSLFEQFTALEAVKEEVLNVQPDETLYYPCLNNSFGESGFHDFYFSRYDSGEDKKLFQWYIHDLTPQYEKIVGLQQSRNETYIDKEHLIQKNKELKLKSELLSGVEFDSNRHVFIKNDSLLLNFDTSELYYAEAYGDYVKLHTSDKTFLVYSTMKKIEDKLSTTEFVRVHRSFIVRIDKIDNIHSTNLEIKDRIIPISSLNKSKLMKKIDIL